jgi:hypothetical protein
MTKATAANAVTPQKTSPAAVAEFNGSKYKIARRVTLPTINPKTNEPVVLRIEDEMRISTYSKPQTAEDVKAAKPKEKPATICTVTNMETGEVALLLVSEVVKTNLEEHYPDGDYVGRVFGMQKLPKREGKRYFDFEITELELAE